MTDDHKVSSPFAITALSDAGRVGTFLARGNVVAAVVIGGHEIANGESPSSADVETDASLLAGAAVAGLVTAGVLTAPAWGSVFF